MNDSLFQSGALKDLATSVLSIEAESILSLKNRIDSKFIDCIKYVIESRGKIICTGIGKSGIIARKFASTLSSTGTAAVFLHPSEALHGDLGILAAEDLVLALSYTGGSAEFGPILAMAQRKKIKVIAITGNKESPLAKAANLTLDVKIDKEACPLGLAPTSSSTAMLAFVDAIAMCVMKAKAFGSEDFAENHPGGGLGRRLLKIKDLMHSGNSLPLVSHTTPVKEIFSLMSRGEVRGAAGVLDANSALCGVITDGDIRRRLDQSGDPFAGDAESLMSRNPRTIDANEWAERAVFLMEEFKINVLFVLDKTAQESKRPVGILHIQDVLKSNVR